MKSRTMVPFKRAQRGLAVVEFAITAPLLALFFVAATELGYVYHTYTTLNKSLENGLRYLSGKSITGGLVTELKAADVSVAKNLVVTGRPAGGEPLVNGLTTTMVTIECVSAVSGGGPNCNVVNGISTIRVQIDYPYTPLMGGAFNAMTGTSLFPLTLTSSSIMPVIL